MWYRWNFEENAGLVKWSKNKGLLFAVITCDFDNITHTSAEIYTQPLYAVTDTLVAMVFLHNNNKIFPEKYLPIGLEVFGF